MPRKTPRKEAKLKGEKFYFSENPCKEGHLVKRVTVTGTCTECRKIAGRARGKKVYALNKEKILNKNKVSRLRRLEKDREQKRQYYLKNKDKTLQYQKEYRENNRAKDRAWKKAYKERKAQRTPIWLTEEHKLSILQFYLEAERLTKETGISHHVDHIVPLRGNTVSGLHVPWNLQILTYLENRKKSNRILENVHF